MSHFVGLVFGDNIEGLLEPYDENVEVEPYVKYTKDEAIEEVKTRRADTYRIATEAVDRYEGNSELLEWQKQRLKWAKEIVERGLSISRGDAWEEAKGWGYDMDEEENLLSTYNPDSKWDWYSEGGRWGAWLILKEKDENGEPLNAIFATKEEVDWDAMLEKNRIPFCFVTSDGDWHESAEIGWWAMTANEKEERDWKKEFLEYLESVEDDIEVSVIDFHI